jgi:hypothetical protein
MVDWTCHEGEERGGSLKSLAFFSQKGDDNVDFDEFLWLHESTVMNVEVRYARVPFSCLVFCLELLPWF